MISERIWKDGITHVFNSLRVFAAQPKVELFWLQSIDLRKEEFLQFAWNVTFLCIFCMGRKEGPEICNFAGDLWHISTW